MCRTGVSVNILFSGNADSVTEFFVSRVPVLSEDDRVFSQRAISLFKALIPLLVALRDSGERDLTLESLRSALSVDEFLALGKRASEGKIPENVASSMSAFMASLGISPNRSPVLEKTKQQFHYISILANRAIDLGAAPPLVGNIHTL